MTQPLLLTPGPLTTADATRAAMAVDLGSRDPAFTEVTARIRRELVALIEGEGWFSAVPIQGSGTFAIEAMLGTLVPREGGLLVLINGAYGERMLEIGRSLGLRAHSLVWDEVEPVDPATVEAWLAEHPEVTHVAVVHCETTSGLRNPVERVAAVVAGAGRELLIDSMSALGALPLSARDTPFQAVVSSANKCLEGVPGFGFAIARTEALERAVGRSRSVSLDLAAQHARFLKDGQWRFTPPTHVLLAFDAALRSWQNEGGQPGRLARYQDNCDALVAGMRGLGFRTLLPDALQAPIIVTFHTPDHPAWHFGRFYEGLVRRGFAIYPGKLTTSSTFRVGCIGQIHRPDVAGFLEAVGDVGAELGLETT